MRKARLITQRLGRAGKRFHKTSIPCHPASLYLKIYVRKSPIRAVEKTKSPDTAGRPPGISVWEHANQSNLKT